MREIAADQLPLSHDWAEVDRIDVFCFATFCRRCGTKVEYHTALNAPVTNVWLIWCSREPVLANCEELRKASRMEDALS